MSRMWGLAYGTTPRFYKLSRMVLCENFDDS